MTKEIAKLGRRKLVFDGDGSQFLPDGKPCTLCGRKMEATDVPSSVFIRVREKLESGGTRELAHVCPDCVARMFLQVTRLGLWNQVSSVVMAAIKRLLLKRHVTEASPARSQTSARQALGSVPQPKIPSRGLTKLLPEKKK